MVEVAICDKVAEAREDAARWRADTTGRGGVRGGEADDAPRSAGENGGCKG